MADAAGLAVSHFRGLRVHLTQLASGAAVDLHALRIQLEKSRPAFRQLLVERPQNADERREIEALHFTPLGASKRRAIDNTFKSEALFLSSELSISERLAASLLHAAQTGDSPNPDRPQAENAVLLFHERRRDLLVSLELLLSTLSDSTVLQTLDASAQSYLVQYASELVTSSASEAGPSTSSSASASWTKQVLSELDNQWKAVHKLQTGNTRPAVGDYSGGPTAQFGEAIRAVQIQAHREERIALATLLYYAAAARLLSQDDILSLVRWCAAQKDQAAQDTIAPTLTAIFAVFDGSFFEPDVLLHLASDEQQIHHRTSAADLFSMSFGALLGNSRFLRDLHSFIKTAANWKNTSHRAVQLAWGLFLIQLHKYQPSLLSEAGVPSADGDVDNSVMDAIKNGVFTFCADSLLAFKKPSDPYEELGWSAGTKEELGSGGSGGGEDITLVRVDPSLQGLVTQRLDGIVEALFSYALRTLGRVKRLEQDERDAKMLTTSRAAGSTPTRRRSRSFSRTSTTATGENQAQTSQYEHRHGMEALCTLLATLYRDAPDAALKYWVHDADSAAADYHQPRTTAARTLNLMRWIGEFQDFANMPRTFFDMLGSLATGPHSALYAFEMLAQNSVSGRGGASLPCSWAALFQALSYYGSLRPQDGAAELPPEEITLLKSFLRLLRIVASSSARACSLLYDNQQYKPVTTLFTFIASGTAIDLKAAALEAVAAFTQPASKVDGPGMVAMSHEIAKRAWYILEGSQFLPTIAQRDARGIVVRPEAMREGIVRDLEELEANFKVYSATTAFVNLLISMLGGTSDLETISLGTTGGSGSSNIGSDVDSVAAISTIPSNLGAPYRSPSEGINAYTRFVIDEVLLRAGSRGYRVPNERWRVTERCLAYIERCLASLSFDRFIELAASGGRIESAGVQQLLAHPGFDILIRILGGSALLAELLNLASTDVEVLDDEVNCSNARLQSVLRTLRIFARIFTLQPPFIEVVLPSLLENSSSVPGDRTNTLRAVLPLEQHLLYDNRQKGADKTHIVVKIAVLVNAARSKRLALAVVQILSALSDSSTFGFADQFSDFYRTKMNRLAGLIDASDETVRVRDGFVRRLSLDERFEDTAFSSSSTTNEAPPDSSDDSPLSEDIDTAIQASILDLLLVNTQPGRPSPNLAHLLIGCDIRLRSDELDLTSVGSSSCLTVVLEYLARIQADATGADAFQDVPNLLLEAPSVAEKSYRLIRQLCLHEHTARAVAALLRTEYDFFVGQSQILPLEYPVLLSSASGRLTNIDGTQIDTSAEIVTSCLYSQAWLMEALSLEVNELVNAGRTDKTLQILSALYDSYSSVETAAGSSMHRRKRDADQALPRMLDLFYSLDFTWQDSIAVNELPISSFASVNFDHCLRRQASGCIIYDFEAVLATLQRAKQALQEQGAITSQQQQDAVREEKKAILENLVIENNRREIQHARLHTLKAWRNLLDVTLSRAWHMVSGTTSATLLLDLLSSVLPPIVSEGADAELQEILAGAALLLITQLRNEALRDHSASQGPSSPLYATDRLLPILQMLVRAIVEQGLPASVRGNLYAAFLHYIQHCSSSIARASATGPGAASGNNATALMSTNDDVFTSASESSADDALTLDGASTVGGSKRLVRRSTLEAGNVAIIQSSLNKLLPIVCMDAADGNDVWQTVAYSMLNALCQAAGQGSTGSKLAGLLAKHGYLQAFVTSIKDREADIIDTLQSDPESLNAYYVYEAKMCFLIRVASTREGAERLLDAQILAKLGQCSFLDISPIDSDAMEYDTFLPPVALRRHHLMVLALQLVLAVSNGCGQHNLQAAQQISDFLRDQSVAMRSILDQTTLAPSLLLLREAQMLLQLLQSSLPAVKEETLSNPSLFGGLHTSVLGLVSTVLSEQDWIASISPASDEEQASFERLLPDVGRPISAYEDQLLTRIEGLQAGLLEYLKSTTKRPGSSTFRPVWQPTLQLEQSNARSNGKTALRAPTLRDAFVFLLDSAGALKETVQNGQELAFKVANFDELGIDDLDLYDDVETGQPSSSNQRVRRQKILTNLKALQTKLSLRLQRSLHIVETTLLLVWRHLSYFLGRNENDGSSSDSLRPSADGRVATYRPQPLQGLLGDQQELKKRASKAFDLILEPLEGIQLTDELLRGDARAHQALLSSLLRSTLDILAEGSQ